MRFSWILLTILKEFDRCDCQIYESVARMPPFKRKMLILIGAIGVGREAIAKRLIATVKVLIKSKNNELKKAPGAIWTTASRYDAPGRIS